MSKPTIPHLEKIMTKIVFPFYQIKRDAIPPFEPRRAETDAEHSWSVGFLACTLAPEIDKSLDLGKIAQFAIVHDLVEVYAGDTSPWHTQNKRESKDEREKKALEQIAKNFSNFPWIEQTILEYESKVSNEAKYVWAVDKLIILLLRYLDKGKFYRDTGVTKKLFDERLINHRKKAHAHPIIGDYYDKLMKLFTAHPEYFYQDSTK